MARSVVSKSKTIFRAVVWKMSPPDNRGIKISMDGRTRWMDNVFVERLWRSLKHEDIYLERDEQKCEAVLLIPL